MHAWGQPTSSFRVWRFPTILFVLVSTPPFKVWGLSIAASLQVLGQPTSPFRVSWPAAARGHAPLQPCPTRGEQLLCWHWVNPHRLLVFGVFQPFLLFRLKASTSPFGVWGRSVAASLQASGEPTSHLGFGASQPFFSFRVSASPVQIWGLSIAAYLQVLPQTTSLFGVWGLPAVP